jgi:hypothetical protein
MAHNMALNNKQYSINRKSIIDNQHTNFWLKENKINPDTLNDTDLLVLHATLTASKTLRNQLRHLTQDQIQALNEFLNKVHTKTKIPSGTIYKTFNICTLAKRKEAKYLRQLNIQSIR